MAGVLGIWERKIIAETKEKISGKLIQPDFE
jgi:hypothetical protein